MRVGAIVFSKAFTFIIITNIYFLVYFIQIVKFEQHSAIIEDLLSKDTTIEDSIEDLNSKDATIEDNVEVMKVNLEGKIGEFDVKIDTLETDISTLIDTKLVEIEDDIVSSSFFFFKT